MRQSFNFEPTGSGWGRDIRAHKGIIRLTHTTLSFAADVWQALGEPAFVAISIDPAQRAIHVAKRLKKGAGGRQLYSAGREGRASKTISIKSIQDKMPLGNYVPIASDIFIHESVYK
jgi:hypothetical protein